ncbi:hypothetical protein [Nocardia asiatica]
MGKPEYTEIDRVGRSASSRNGARVRNFLLHTQEGNGTAESLANYLNNPANGVSYHYTLRDRTLIDVVDTDLASWSVLDANPFTINLCFAGSRSAWSREDWLRIRDDIRIAAWIAVQDARKYGFATTVIAPPYRRGDGISDHRYVTDCLGIGDHTDVGRGFPWDVFARDVQAAAIDGEAPSAEGDTAMSWGEQITNLDGDKVSREDQMKYIDKHTGLALDQLAGPDARRGAGFPGWDFLGDRTVAEMLGALGEKLGIPGCRDPKGGK